MNKISISKNISNLVCNNPKMKNNMLKGLMENYLIFYCFYDVH